MADVFLNSMNLTSVRNTLFIMGLFSPSEFGLPGELRNKGSKVRWTIVDL